MFLLSCVLVVVVDCWWLLLPFVHTNSQIVSLLHSCNFCYSILWLRGRNRTASFLPLHLIPKQSRKSCSLHILGSRKMGTEIPVPTWGRINKRFFCDNHEQLSNSSNPISQNNNSFGWNCPGMSWKIKQVIHVNGLLIIPLYGKSGILQGY